MDTKINEMVSALKGGHSYKTMKQVLLWSDDQGSKGTELPQHDKDEGSSMCKGMEM